MEAEETMVEEEYPPYWKTKFSMRMCSECGAPPAYGEDTRIPLYIPLPRYCWDCGARMHLVEDDKE